MFTECPKVQAPARLGNHIVNVVSLRRFVIASNFILIEKKKKLKKKKIE